MNKENRTFGLIGFPLEHSFSKQYFTEKFQKEGLKGVDYQLFPIHNIDEFPALLKANSSLCGLNVTMPYKSTVMPFLDDLSPEAFEIGAVNTIKIIRKGDELLSKGFNTDTFGFEQSLLPFLKTHHTKAMILGYGGMAKTAKYILNRHNIQSISVSRCKKNKNNCVVYDDIDYLMMKEFTLIINTTPLGQYPETEHCPPIPYEYIGKHHLVFDSIYNPDKTIFLEKAEKQGATIKNGLEMLHLQAERAWEIWNE